MPIDNQADVEAIAKRKELEDALAKAWHAQKTFNNDELNEEEQVAYAKLNYEQISREELTAQRDKYKQDSILLNHIGYRMAVALGKVGDDGATYYGSIEDLLDELVRKANANG